MGSSFCEGYRYNLNIVYSSAIRRIMKQHFETRSRINTRGAQNVSAMFRIRIFKRRVRLKIKILKMFSHSCRSKPVWLSSSVEEYSLGDKYSVHTVNVSGFWCCFGLSQLKYSSKYVLRNKIMQVLNDMRESRRKTSKRPNVVGLFLSFVNGCQEQFWIYQFIYFFYNPFLVPIRFHYVEESSADILINIFHRTKKIRFRSE